MNAPTAYEQLQLLEPPNPDGGLTPLGIPGFAGFFLSLLEEQEGWAIAITRAFAGEPDDVLIIAARGGERIQIVGQPAVAAVEVFRQARELEELRRQGHACQH